jgi:5-methylcytosine-specific restriction protein B
MARFCTDGQDTAAVYQGAARFRERCLATDGSLLYDGASVWTAENLSRLQRRLAEVVGDSDRPFEEKFHARLADAPQAVVRLAAEALAVSLLFPVSISTQRKQQLVATVLGWGGDTLPAEQPLGAAFASGIGSTGQGYHTRRPLELAFLTAFALAWKRQTAANQKRNLQDPWRFQAFLDNLDDADSRQVRHILLHLLFPDHFERIVSSDHKRRAAHAFAGVLKTPPDDLDRCLYEARQELERLLPDQSLDFYQPPLAQAWYDPAGDVEVLHYKKQVVLYGPPGTGKTHRACRLAERIIHSAALERWGGGTYFREQERIEQAVRGNIHFVQLHPAFSYEDFVRRSYLGPGGKPEFRPGVLLRILAQMQAEPADQRLPHVLILDEMNRTDLSRLLGECFSLLEHRDRPVRLPSPEPDGKEPVLSLPPDLYVIGTLNLIDPSLAPIDFALRRRFLWLECPFQADELMQVLREEWTAAPSPYNGWERIEPDCRRLAAAARSLNEAVARSEVLGHAYEIGHACFFDVLEFLRQDLTGACRARKHYLWRNGEPLRPVERLWELSLQPLLSEYLAGLRGRERQEELERFREIFFHPPEVE